MPSSKGSAEYKDDGDRNLSREDLSPPGLCEILRVLSTLDAELLTLDELGAYKASAHLDASIQQLRRDIGVAARVSNMRPQTNSKALDECPEWF